ncbi:MAG: hypothetical protein ACRDRC_14850, partial [Pseudonocardiaceae bacterium]
MPTTLPTQHSIDPAATTPMPKVDTTLQLSARTLNWLAQRPHARLVVDSVWDTLAELERAGAGRGGGPPARSAEPRPPRHRRDP